MTGDLPEDLATRLRSAGLRVTRPRLAVLETLMGHPGHHSADTVYQLLADAGIGLPKASVYNSLTALSDANVVMRADTGPGVALYEFADEWHHHFVCRRCGAILDAACLVGEKPCLDVSIPGVEVDEAQVIYRGLCSDCLSG